MDNISVIDFFEDEYYFLSNYSYSPMLYKGYHYLCAEAAFQAQKCLTDKEREQFTSLEAPAAKRLGRRVQLRPDWEEIKQKEMYEIVKTKFSNPKLRIKLLNTNEAKLIEGNYWHDNYWGDCWCARCHGIKGQNNLGKILMKVRKELK